MTDPLSILNDPTMVPLSADGPLFVTEDGTFIIVSSSLPVRYSSTMFGKTRTWLRTPPRYIKGKKR